MTQFLFAGLWPSIILGVIVASSFPAGMFASQIIGVRRGRLRADAAAFGSGVFFGTISFSLVQQATRLGTPVTLIVGFVIGVTALSTTNYMFMKMEERTKSDEHSTDNGRTLPRKGRAGSAKKMIIGSLLDSIPESLYVGVLVALRASGLYGSVVTLFLGNIAVAFEASQIMLERGKLAKRDILVR